MDYKKLADLLFPNVENMEYYLKKYPTREKKEGEEILRFAPSPTGFIHMGSLFAAFVPEIFAHQTGGSRMQPKFLRNSKSFLRTFQSGLLPSFCRHLWCKPQKRL